MMKKRESTQEDMMGKYNNRPYRVSEWRRDVLNTLIKKLPNYRNHYT
jgi:hypothetical protein